MSDEHDDKEKTSLRKRLREESEQSILEYMNEFADNSAIKVTIVRMEPKVWAGRNIEGILDTFEEPISEEDIKARYGGGKYKITIKHPNSQGKWVYAGQRQCKIAGDPKLDGLEISMGSGGNNKPEDPTIVQEALRMVEMQASRAERRAERAEQLRNSGQPDEALRMAFDELRAARAESAAKDEQLLELITESRGGSNATEVLLSKTLEELRAVHQQSAAKEAKLLEMMMSGRQQQGSPAIEMLFGKAIEGESARILAMQTQHDSEMRLRSEMHRAEVDRLHARSEDTARRQEEAHVREIAQLRQSNEDRIATLKLSYEGQIAALNREIERLNREIGEIKVEATELRARKERGLLDSVTEIATLREALDTLTGGNKEEGGGSSKLERIFETIVSSPLAEGLAARLATASGAMPIPNPSPQTERPELVRHADGTVIVRHPDGTVRQVRQRPPKPQPTGEIPAVMSPEVIASIIPFMEKALANDTDPGMFVSTARTLKPAEVSGPVKDFIEAQGVEAFLELVAQANPDSPLLQQHGRNWTRKVAAILVQ